MNSLMQWFSLMHGLMANKNNKEDNGHPCRVDLQTENLVVFLNFLLFGLYLIVSSINLNISN